MVLEIAILLYLILVVVFFEIVLLKMYTAIQAALVCIKMTAKVLFMKTIQYRLIGFCFDFIYSVEAVPFWLQFHYGEHCKVIGVYVRRVGKVSKVRHLERNVSGRVVVL